MLFIIIIPERNTNLLISTKFHSTINFDNLFRYHMMLVLPIRTKLDLADFKSSFKRSESV